MTNSKSLKDVLAVFKRALVRLKGGKPVVLDGSVYIKSGKVFYTTIKPTENKEVK